MEAALASPDSVRRFMRFIGPASDSGCEEWMGARLPRGYGRFGPRHGTTVYAHRWRYELAHGPIPPGLVVMHSCDNPPCVALAHLSVGTVADNNADRARKGRGPVGAANPAAKLSDETAQEILREFSRGGVTRRALAAKHSVSEATLSNLVSGKSWRHLERVK